MSRVFDPCSGGIEGCLQCVLDDWYDDCDYENKATREEIEENDV